MPSLELAAGQVLTAAHTNTYWMRQVVATGLSSARPTGYEGRAVYDTDDDAYAGVRGFRRPDQDRDVVPPSQRGSQDRLAHHTGRPEKCDSHSVTSKRPRARPVAASLL